MITYSKKMSNGHPFCGFGWLQAAAVYCNLQTGFSNDHYYQCNIFANWSFQMHSWWQLRRQKCFSFQLHVFSSRNCMTYHGCSFAKTADGVCSVNDFGLNTWCITTSIPSFFLKPGNDILSPKQFQTCSQSIPGTPVMKRHSFCLSQ